MWQLGVRLCLMPGLSRLLVQELNAGTVAVIFSCMIYDDIDIVLFISMVGICSSPHNPY